MMRFGVCAGLDRAEAAARAGWDFIEVGVGAFVPSEPDSAYAESTVSGRRSAHPRGGGELLHPGTFG